MISFRFHVVSITAVFLAIAIGVVVGSTYVDRAIVDNLEHRIDTVSENLDARKQANDALEHNLNDLRSYVAASADFAVTDRLTDVPVFLLAVRGVDEEVAAQMGLLARRSGATVPGIVWLEPKWALSSPDDRAALAATIGADESDSVERLQAQVWSAVVQELTVPDSAAGPASTQPALTHLLADLQAGGFLTVDSLDDASVTLGALRGTSPRVLVVTGSRAAGELTSMVSTVIAAPITAGLPTVAAEIYLEVPDGPPRGADLTATVPTELRDRIVLIDDADQPEGRVAAVIALAAAADGLVGHFGYGAGADGVLPGWTPP